MSSAPTNTNWTSLLPQYQSPTDVAQAAMLRTQNAGAQINNSRHSRKLGFFRVSPAVLRHRPVPPSGIGAVGLE